MGSFVAFLCLLGLAIASEEMISRSSRQILFPVVHSVHHAPLLPVIPYAHHHQVDPHYTLHHGSANGYTGSFGRPGSTSASATNFGASPNQFSATSSQGFSSGNPSSSVSGQQQGQNQLGQSYGTSQTSSSMNTGANSQQPGLAAYYSFGAQGSAQSNTNNAAASYQSNPQSMQGSTQSTASDNQNQGQNVPILSQSYTQHHDGSYNFGYHTGNGIHFTETASVQPAVFPSY